MYLQFLFCLILAYSSCTELGRLENDVEVVVNNITENRFLSLLANSILSKNNNSKPTSGIEFLRKCLKNFKINLKIQATLEGNVCKNCEVKLEQCPSCDSKPCPKDCPKNKTIVYTDKRGCKNCVCEEDNCAIHYDSCTKSFEKDNPSFCVVTSKAKCDNWQDCIVCQQCIVKGKLCEPKECDHDCPYGRFLAETEDSCGKCDCHHDPCEVTKCKTKEYSKVVVNSKNCTNNTYCEAPTCQCVCPIESCPENCTFGRKLTIVDDCQKCLCHEDPCKGACKENEIGTGKISSNCSNGICDNPTCECKPACDPTVCPENCEFGAGNIYRNGCPVCECHKTLCDEFQCPTKTLCNMKVDSNCQKTNKPCPPPTPTCLSCENPQCSQKCYMYKSLPNGCASCDCVGCENYVCGSPNLCDDDDSTCSAYQRQCEEEKCTKICVKPKCSNLCEYGNKVDEFGCEICDCYDNPCENYVCTDKYEKCRVDMKCSSNSDRHCPPKPVCLDPCVQSVDAIECGSQDTALKHFFYNKTTKSCFEYPKGKCPRYLTDNFFTDNNVCMECAKPKCPDISCNTNCAFGYSEDANGCPTCACYNPCDYINCNFDTCKISNEESCLKKKCTKEQADVKCVPRCRYLKCSETCPFGTKFVDNCPTCECEVSKCLNKTCATGLVCRQGWSEVKSVYEAKCVNPCIQQVETRQCIGCEQRFFWDNKQKTCRKYEKNLQPASFNYFDSLESCENICKTKCPNSIDNCGPLVNCKFGYKLDSNDCTTCECINPCDNLKCGGGNFVCKACNWITDKECDQKFNAKCVDICYLPKNQGWHEGCTEKKNNRFYWDASANKCNQLEFKGCLGNRNNFASQNECESTCKHCREVVEIVKPILIKDTIEV